MKKIKIPDGIVVISVFVALIAVAEITTYAFLNPEQFPYLFVSFILGITSTIVALGLD